MSKTYVDSSKIDFKQFREEVSSSQEFSKELVTEKKRYLKPSCSFEHEITNTLTVKKGVKNQRKGSDGLTILEDTHAQRTEKNVNLSGQARIGSDQETGRALRQDLQVQPAPPPPPGKMTEERPYSTQIMNPFFIERFSTRKGKQES